MKKIIAFIYSEMTTGGVEKALVNLLKVFDYDHYDVTLWLLRQGGELLSEVPEEVNIRYWGGVGPRAVVMDHLNKGRIFKMVGDLYHVAFVHLFKNNYSIAHKHLADMLPMVTEEIYDFFVVYHGWDFRCMYHSLRRFRARNRILWLHNEPWEPAKYYQPYIGEFDKIFCVSESIRDQADQLLSKHYGKNNMEVIHNIVDEEDVIRKSEEHIEELRYFSLVTVGRLGLEKGQEMVPEIVRKLLDDGIEVTWYLVGEGVKRSVIEENIARFDVADHVILLGLKANPYPYMRNCDLYVQPSFTEGYCTTTIEAKILHKPILVTDVPGMREQFRHMENGYIVASPTVDCIYEGIRCLVRDDALRKRFVKQLSEERVLENGREMQKLYDYLKNHED